MLDIKRIRFDFEKVKNGLLKRGSTYNIEKIIEYDIDRRKLLTEVEEQKAKQNEVSKNIPKLKKEGKDVSEVLNEMKKLSDDISSKNSTLKEIEENITEVLLGIPNVPNEDVPIGETDEENIEIRKYGDPKEFSFDVKAHWDIGTDLDILDFERGAKIIGARFTLFKGLGAKLERAITSFMLDIHTEEHGYVEVSPPFIANRESMTGTGQLPKFSDDMFKIEGKEFYLIPTAEVPVTNIYRGEILEEEDLPIYHTAYTPCFRQEAGSAGRDTRGLIRNHQFDKVELVKFSKRENSYDELEKLTSNAEKILQLLEIPYRVVQLCSGDLGFSSAKTYDIEVWMPSYNRYVEISSCSNFEDYQGRRANIRYRSKETGKLEFVHTLNGSGLAVGRTLAAILENYQNEDGTVTIPKVLKKYLRDIEKIG